MIAAMMVAAVSANAQFEPGTFSIQPKVGMGLSKVSNMPAFDEGGFKLDKSLLVGAVIGAEAEYQIADIFSVAGGLHFSMQGCQWKDTDFVLEGQKIECKDFKLELNYVNVPIVANLYVVKGLAIKTGVQFGFLVDSKYKTTIKHGDVTKTVDYDVKDYANKFDVSIPVGLSYQVPTIPIYIDARAYFGLTNIVKDKYVEEGEKNSKNQVFQLTVGYKFAL